MKLVKLLAKMFFVILSWESVIRLILELAVKLLAGWLGEKTFTKKAKYFVMGIYVFSEGLFDELAKDTKSESDDDLVKNANTLCKEIAAQQGFKLPDVQEL